MSFTFTCARVCIGVRGGCVPTAGRCPGPAPGMVVGSETTESRSATTQSVHRREAWIRKGAAHSPALDPVQGTKEGSTAEGQSRAVAQQCDGAKIASKKTRMESNKRNVVPLSVVDPGTWWAKTRVWKDKNGQQYETKSEEGLRPQKRPVGAKSFFKDLAFPSGKVTNGTGIQKGRETEGIKKRGSIL